MLVSTLRRLRFLLVYLFAILTSSAALAQNGGPTKTGNGDLNQQFAVCNLTCIITGSTAATPNPTASGARWKPNGAPVWYQSGEVAPMGPGTCQISFQNAGKYWAKPAPMSVGLSAQTKAVHVVYKYIKPAPEPLPPVAAGPAEDKTVVAPSRGFFGRVFSCFTRK